MEALGAVLLPVLFTLYWALAPGVIAEDCTGFRHLQNGRTFFRYGGLYATFSCNPGFRMHGYRTSSCVSGQWARPPPLCVAPGCPSPGQLLHGTTSMAPDGSLVQFTCSTGFKLLGSALLYCKGNSWNGSTPVCKELDIMNLFQQKQLSLHKPGMESEKKPHFSAIVITAAKETFIKTSLLGAPQPKPQVNGDLFKNSQKHVNLLKSTWHEETNTEGSLKTVGHKDKITTRLHNMGEPTILADPLNQPNLATLASSLTVSSTMALPDILVTSTINDQQEVSSKFLDQMLSSTPKEEDKRHDYLTSTSRMHHQIPSTPLQVLGVSGGTNLDVMKTHLSSLENVASRDAPTVAPKILKNSELSSTFAIIIKASTDEDISQMSLQVTEDMSTAVSTTSSSDFPVYKSQMPLTSKPFPTTLLTSSPPFIPSGIHDGEHLQSMSAVRDFPPRMELATAHIPTIHSSPDVTTKDSKGSTTVDKNPQEHHGPSGGQIDGELYDILRSGKIGPANRTAVVSNHDQENASKQNVMIQTLKSAAKRNVTVNPSAISGFPVFHTRKQRPVCPYPPLPVHGTFYFRTIRNPAPFQYRHYIQYACYAGYTLVSGDVYSYCLQDGQWSGVTPMCIALTPCSLNNGGCSQVCQLNMYNHAECHCEPGFLLLGDQRTCRDLDECVEGVHECQQICENTFGSYRCSCSLGFQLSSDRKSCTDINECAQRNGGCSHICMNHRGGYKCACTKNYHLSPHNRKKCQPV